MRPIDDKPHPREVKNVFTVFLPLSRNWTLIITEKIYIKSLNTSTGSQVEEKKKSFLCPHTLSCFRGTNTYSCWLGKEGVWEGDRSCGMNQATLSSHFSYWSDAALLLSPLSPPTAPRGGWCLQIHTSGHHPRGNGGEKILNEQEENPEGKKRWKRDWWQGKDSEWKEHRDLWEKEQRINWVRMRGKTGVGIRLLKKKRVRLGRRKWRMTTDHESISECQRLLLIPHIFFWF